MSQWEFNANAEQREMLQEMLQMSGIDGVPNLVQASLQFYHHALLKATAHSQLPRYEDPKTGEIKEVSTDGLRHALGEGERLRATTAELDAAAKPKPADPSLTIDSRADNVVYLKRVKGADGQEKS